MSPTGCGAPCCAGNPGRLAWLADAPDDLSFELIRPGLAMRVAIVGGATESFEIASSTRSTVWNEHDGRGGTRRGHCTRMFQSG